MHPVWRFWRGISAGAGQARAESSVRLPRASSSYSDLTYSHDVAFLVSDGCSATVWRC